MSVWILWFGVASLGSMAPTADEIRRAAPLTHGRG
jgi:hypothetical protein